MIRTLIVDDEALAREGLRDFLAGEPDAELVGECRNGDEALDAIRAGGVDLVLLDVQMPERDGFEVLKELDESALPAVIFVTAYDRYALDAFRVHAVDYLLKPIERERFRTAMERVRQRLRVQEAEAMNRRILTLLEDLERRENDPGRLLVKGGGRSFFVRIERIDWIEAAGNYATLHAADGDHVVRETMTSLETRLRPFGFARIHRSYIVNLERVREIQPWFKGDHVVILDDGTKLSLTRKYRADLERRLGRKI
ncbi:MAG: LytR/AlgR family response regulator transcription factor [Gemmatimonadota bacterium]